MIGGVIVREPKVYHDRLGAMMRMLRTDDPNFAGFGEIYFSTVNPGAIKGWKQHREMTMTIAVPVGRVLFVIYDDRPDSPTRNSVQEIELGPHEYKTVTVPPLLWNGFMGLGKTTSVLANCASILHRPDEVVSRDISESSIPYNWPKPA